MSKNIETAKEIIKKNIKDVMFDIIDSRNIVGNCMKNLYEMENW